MGTAANMNYVGLVHETDEDLTSHGRGDGGCGGQRDGGR